MSQAQILQILLLPGVLSFIVGIVITGVITSVNYLLPKLPAAQQARAKAIVSSVVSAVEQSSTSLAGADKKAKAVQDVESILTALKISVPSTLINTLIESSVYEINQAQTTGNVTPAPAPINWTADALQAIQIMSGATTATAQPVHGPGVFAVSANDAQPATVTAQTPIPAFTATAQTPVVSPVSPAQ
jgi:Bacteriophage holin of superfamily 6 (Holin_LLH)